MPSKHAMSIHQSMIDGRIMDAKKHNKKQRKRMQEKPESVVYNYKYECLDKSGVITFTVSFKQYLDPLPPR